MANDGPDTGRRVSTRRDFLRNSAVMGGVAWAAPTVLSLGPNAFATNGGSPRCYRFRYEVSKDEEPAQIECSDNQNWVGCDPIEDWATYTCVDYSNVGDLGYTGTEPAARIPEGEIIFKENRLDGEPVTVTITLPEDCVYSIVEAKSGPKDGGDCSEIVTPDEPSNSFTVRMGNVGLTGPVKDVSHVDVVFCCS